MGRGVLRFGTNEVQWSHAASNSTTDVLYGTDWGDCFKVHVSAVLLWTAHRLSCLRLLKCNWKRWLWKMPPNV